MKRKLWAILMSLALILSYMPLTASAATKSKITAIKYVAGAEEPYGYIGESSFWFDSEGAAVTFVYSDKTENTFIYHDGYYDEDSGIDYEGGFYLNGDMNNPPLDMDSIELYSQTERCLRSGNNTGFLCYWIDEDNYVRSNEFNVIGGSDEDIISIEYTQHKIWDSRIEFWDDNESHVDYDINENFVGDELIITSRETEWDEDTDEPEEKIVTNHYTGTIKQDYDGDGELYDYYVFVNDEDPDDEAWISFVDDQLEDPWKPGEIREVEIYFCGVRAPQTAKVQVQDIVIPEKTEFVPAVGYNPDRLFIGQEFVSEYDFFGGGNKFVMSFSDGSTKEFYYLEKHNGFYLNGVYSDSYNDRFFAEANIEGGLVKGTQDITLITYYNDAETGNQFEVPCTVSITAEKYDAWGYGNSYTYTGKVIKPKFVINNSVGETLPASAYSYKKLKNKNVGVYEVQINIKDTTNYFTPTWVYYSINPKNVTAKKLTAGKKKATITWKKFSKADQKQITGFKVEYSLYKNFKKSTVKNVSKKAGSYTIKGLKSKKTYYVRVYAYKNSKFPWGEKIVLKSLKSSKVKKVKVK